MEKPKYLINKDTKLSDLISKGSQNLDIKYLAQRDPMYVYNRLKLKSGRNSIIIGSIRDFIDRK